MSEVYEHKMGCAEGGEMRTIDLIEELEHVIGTIPRGSSTMVCNKDDNSQRLLTIVGVEWVVEVGAIVILVEDAGK